MTPSLQEQIACVKREIGLREHLYPRWVSKGTMTQAKADHEIAAMKTVLQTLKQLDAAQRPDLFR